jgi:3D (Asp-Asp-Asp) domain-containing protein
MLKRVHVAGVLALGLSGFAAAQTTTDPASPTHDQVPPQPAQAAHQPGSALFLTPTVLGGTLTQHLAGAALLLHREAALWPSVPQTTTIQAPVPASTAEESSAELSTELSPQATAPTEATFNEDTSAVAAADLPHDGAPSAALSAAPKVSAAQRQAAPPQTARPKAGPVQAAPTEADLNLPVLPSAALTSTVVDLALATAPAQQAGGQRATASAQLARLRLLQAQNPRRSPAVTQAEPVTARPAPVQPVAVKPAATKPAPVALKPVRPARVQQPSAVQPPVPEIAAAVLRPVQARPEISQGPAAQGPAPSTPATKTPAPSSEATQVTPAPMIVVNVRVPAVQAPVKASPAPIADPVVKTVGPVKSVSSAPAPAQPVVAKPSAVKPVAAKPVAAKPAAAPTRSGSGSSGPVVGGTRLSGNGATRSGRPQASGASRMVSATAYSSDVAQTDSTPFVTATGTRVRPGVIALSRDLLRTFPYGSRVTLQDSAGILNGRIYLVEDTMNARLRNTIDIWMGSRSQAYRWGRRTVRITAVR